MKMSKVGCGIGRLAACPHYRTVTKYRQSWFRADSCVLVLGAQEIKSRPPKKRLAATKP